MEKVNKTPFLLHPTTGIIRPENVVGREVELSSILYKLISQSVHVAEIRRMGKTLFLQKLEYWCNKELLPSPFKENNLGAKYFSFQGISNLGELIDTLVQDLESFRKWYQIDLGKYYEFTRKILNSPTVKVGDANLSIKLPEYKKEWKEIFITLLNTISENTEKDKKILILIFDELPIMLWNWMQNNNYTEAIELLDVLRKERQRLESKGIRFVFSGSIGINVVLDTLKREHKYTGEPMNDVAELHIGSFTREETHFLCECFLLSEFTLQDEKSKSQYWEYIQELTNGLPYYIATIFTIIRDKSLHARTEPIISEASIDEAYAEIMNNTSNHKHFNQLRERITIYYPDKDAAIMLNILSLLSVKQEWTNEEDIIAQMDNSENEIKNALYKLREDCYLLKETNPKKVYKFKYEIFKKWWTINFK